MVLGLDDLDNAKTIYANVIGGFCFSDVDVYDINIDAYVDIHIDVDDALVDGHVDVDYALFDVHFYVHVVKVDAYHNGYEGLVDSDNLRSLSLLTA